MISPEHEARAMPNASRSRTRDFRHFAGHETRFRRRNVATRVTSSRDLAERDTKEGRFLVGYRRTAFRRRAHGLATFESASRDFRYVHRDGDRLVVRQSMAWHGLRNRLPQAARHASDCVSRPAFGLDRVSREQTRHESWWLIPNPRGRSCQSSSPIRSAHVLREASAQR